LTGSIATSDTFHLNITTNTNSLLHAIGALSVVALLTSPALASEPRRILDTEKERFVPNPDYRSSARVTQVAWAVAPAPERTALSTRKPMVSRRTVPLLAGARFLLSSSERKD
jgi:hypothetical protein